MVVSRWIAISRGVRTAAGAAGRVAATAGCAIAAVVAAVLVFAASGSTSSATEQFFGVTTSDDAVVLSEGWGATVAGFTVRNIGEALQLGPVTVDDSRLEAVSNCADRRLDTGAQCFVSVFNRSTEPGQRAGTVSVSTIDGQVLATVDVTGHSATALIAYEHDERGETTSGLETHETGTGSVSTANGGLFIGGGSPGGVSVSVQPVFGERLTAGRLTIDRQANGASASIQPDGFGCQANRGHVDIDHVTYDVDGALSTIVAHLQLACGVGTPVRATIAYDATGGETGLAMPSSADFGWITDDVPRSISVVNASSAALQLDSVSVEGHLRLVSGCDVVEAWSVCDLSIAPGVTRGALTGTVRVEAAGRTLSSSLTGVEADAVAYSVRSADEPLSSLVWSSATTPTAITTDVDAGEVSVLFSTNDWFSARTDGTPIEVGQNLGGDGPGNAFLPSSVRCGDSDPEATVRDIELVGDRPVSLTLEFVVDCFSERRSIWLHVNTRPEVGLVAAAAAGPTTHRQVRFGRTTVAVYNVGDRPLALFPHMATLTGNIDVDEAWRFKTDACPTLLPVDGACEIDVLFTPNGAVPSTNVNLTFLGAAASSTAIGFFGSPPLDWRSRTVHDGPAPPGYWLLDESGGVWPLGNAHHLGDSTVVVPVQLIATPTGRGYWILGADGDVSAHGDAPELGGIGVEVRASMRPGEHAVSFSVTQTGQGYWIFTSHGRVVSLGDAGPMADLLHLDLAAPIIDSKVTRDGDGVYMLGADGGVFALGGARFFGSVPQVLPGVQLDQPIIGMTVDPDGLGYWLVAADGGVFAFDAPFRGSVPQVLPGVQLDQPVAGMVSHGSAYLLVARDGGTFNFSELPFAGSLSGSDRVYVGVGTVVL